MKELITIELTWEQVEEKMSEILRRILDIGFECTTSQDDTDFWGVKLGGYRMSIDEVDTVCNFVNATPAERKDAYPSDESEKTVGDLGVDIANKLLGISLGISFNRFLVQDECLLLIDCKKSESIRIEGNEILFDELKSRNELLDYLVQHSPNERSLFMFAAEYHTRFKNELIWHFPLRSGKHLGAFFVLVKEGILFVPYDDADKVNGGVFNLDAIRMTDRETIRWNINRLESLYCVGKDALHDLEAFLLKQEKKNEWG